MKRQASKKTAFIAGIMFSLLLLLSEVIKESFELPESIEGLGVIFLMAIVLYGSNVYVFGTNEKPKGNKWNPADSKYKAKIQESVIRILYAMLGAIMVAIPVGTFY
jgi:ABC-type phosphate transport system permease subunit